jgi:hypothetical protein
MAIDSTSDERVANNVMRHEYRVLTEHEKTQMKNIKDLGLLFVQKCDNLYSHGIGPNNEAIRVGSRELSLAKTKIEEAVFWAVKHITR